jgi:hypothetical protein
MVGHVVEHVVVLVNIPLPLLALVLVLDGQLGALGQHGALL